MAANSTSFDLVTDLLSTNNTINIAALLGVFLFGALTVYGCVLTWRHQRWERQLEEDRAAGRTDDPETGISYPLQVRNPGSDDETAVEDEADTASPGRRGSQSAPSSEAFGEYLPRGRTAIQGIATGGAEDTSDCPGSAGAILEGETSRPPAGTGNPTIPTPHNALNVNILEDGGNGMEASVGLSE